MRPSAHRLRALLRGSSYPPEHLANGPNDIVTAYEALGLEGGQKAYERWRRQEGYYLRLDELTREAFEILWELLSDVPVDEEEEIQIDFFQWPEGTPREEIWMDIDEYMPVAFLSGQMPEEEMKRLQLKDNNRAI